MPKTQRLTRQRAQDYLPPRLRQLKALLEEGPKTAKELAAGLGFRDGQGVPIVRSYLSQLAKVVPVHVEFEYGASRYSIPKNSAIPS